MGGAALVLPLILCSPSWGQGSSPATERLLERNRMFEPRIVQVSPSVYVSVGHQVSTGALIVGDDGVVVIDPGLVPGVGEQVREVYRQVADKPVKAIIYTHGHPDHTLAASAFHAEGVQVWARANFGSEPRLVRRNGYLGGVRSANTQGFDLPAEQRIGVGIGIPPAVRPAMGGALMADGMEAANRPVRPRAIAPTHTFDGDSRWLELAGLSLKLAKAPGETDDQLYIWFPAERVLFAGDNFYQSWPNTYPLRGTARRSVRDWIQSLGAMIQEGPEVVVPGHTAPMTDATTVLTNYRDALQWVLERTVQGARAGLTPDALIDYTKLPSRLADLDYLQDYYGSRGGTVRDIYAQDLGWFDGNALNLHRESPKRQAQRLSRLAGGLEALAAKAKAALESGDFLGAAQLADAWSRLAPDDPEPWSVLADALSAVAERTLNAPARNYTFSTANRARERADRLQDRDSLDARTALEQDAGRTTTDRTEERNVHESASGRQP